MFNRNLDWRAVPLPPEMLDLEKDQRGLPIPFVVQRDLSGSALFTVNDTAKVLKCFQMDLCPICGKKLQRGRWFVGGPLSAFHEEGCYIDPPVHAGCMRYALQVCPYLAAPKYTGRLDDAKVDYDLLDGTLLVDPTVLPDRPEVFVAVMTVGQKVVRNQDQVYVRPNRPYHNMEFWVHGQRTDRKKSEAWCKTIVAEFDPATILPKKTRYRIDKGDRL